MSHTLLPAAAEASASMEEARQSVKRRRDVYPRLATAALVIAITIAMILATGGRPWFPWVIFGIAIAIGSSAFGTFGRTRWLGRDGQERTLREVLDRPRSR